MASERSRKAWKARTSAIRELYKHLCDEDCRTRCWYCGDSADTVDHCPAIEVAWACGTEALRSAKIDLLLIPACRECNVLLGDIPLFTPESRGFWLYERLATRYKKVSDGGTFDDEDLQEFGYNLRHYLKNAAQSKQWIERRLSFAGRFPICERALRFLPQKNNETTIEQKP